MKFKFLLLHFIIILLLFVSCPISEDDGQGIVTLHLSTQNNSIRTIIPDISQTIVEYRITCSGPITLPSIVSSDTVVELSLSTGLWNIFVEALNSDQKIVAYGLIEEVQISTNSQTSITIILHPTQTTLGGVNITINWPISLIIPIENIEVSFDSTAINLGSDLISYTTTSINYTNLSVPSGSNHTYRVRLFPEEASGPTIREDAVHVYDDVTTLYTYSLEEADFEMLPFAPDSLSANPISTHEIDLYWNDNSINENEFYIERSTDGISYSIIDSVPADVITYTDSNLNSDTQYYYRICASNSYGNSSFSNSVSAVTKSLLIINHNSIALFDSIPQQYIDNVKKTLLILGGESHGRAYMYGLDLVESDFPEFAVNVKWTGEAEAYTEEYLRANRAHRKSIFWEPTMGEEDFFTNSSARNEIISGLSYIDSNYSGKIYFGFGWCYDMSWMNPPGGVIDPIYGCRWGGSSMGGPEGNLIWGLDSEDNSLTGNSVNMQTYLDAVDLYNSTQPSITTFFTTGPVDGFGNSEAGYQRFLKQEYIRDYVLNNGGILFDFADILSWDYSLSQRIPESWNGHTWDGANPSLISPEYDGGDGGCHLSEEGCLLLGKAIWVMLALDAGWEGL